MSQGPFEDPGLTLPHTLDAERSVLGSILLENAALRPAQHALGADDFYRDDHRRIFRVMGFLSERSAAIDLLTVKEELERRGELETAGGIPYLSSLVDGVPKSANIEHYARIVKEKAILRRIIASARCAAEAACSRNGAAPGEDLERVRAAIESVNAAASALQPHVEELCLADLAAEPPPLPEPLVGDGRQRLISSGDLDVVASDPGAGKTITMLGVALGVASGTVALEFPCRQAPVLYASSDGDAHLLAKLHRLWRGLGRAPDELALLPLGLHVDDGFNLDDDACFGGLVATLERRGFSARPGLLAIESLATNVGPDIDLNDQLSVRRWATRRLRALQARFNRLTVIVSAHLKKPQHQGVNDLATRVAGSIQIRAAVDAIIGLVPRGRERFAVREVKRSRSGGTFEPFEVQIEGVTGEPLVLRNVGTVEPSLEDLRGAAAAAMAWFHTSGREKAPLKDIKAALASQFKERAIEGACKRLSESDPPLLMRVSGKPAIYEMAPKQGVLDVEELG